MNVKYATVEATEPDQLSVAVGRVMTTVPRIERLRPGMLPPPDTKSGGGAVLLVSR